MIQKSARPRPLAGTRPQMESNAGANDDRIVTHADATLNELPAPLIVFAEAVAIGIVELIRGGAR